MTELDDQSSDEIRGEPAAQSKAAAGKRGGLLGSSFVVSMGTMLSRVLGLARDVVLANLARCCT
jgi:putative peptidoglycan lipid II flippase